VDDPDVVGQVTLDRGETVIAVPASLILTAADQIRQSQGRRTKRLNVSHAFHSPHMDAMLDEFHAIVSGLTFHPPRIRIVPTLTGQLATAEQMCLRQY
jgi:acyl transferase domain-containing protein